MSAVAPGNQVSKDALRDEAKAWAERINVRPRRIQVQAMATKWASCSTRGTVTLSLGLLSEPAAFREMVIVHELVHLLVPNHGRVFKGLMKAYVPDWEQRWAGMRGRGRECLVLDRAVPREVDREHGSGLGR